MTFFNALRIVAIIHICFFSAQNLYAKSDICKGRWAYNKYKLCTHCNFGIKSHVVKRSERCGVEQYNQGRGDVCGVESWKEERGPICGVERYKESPRSLNPGALTLRTPSVDCIMEMILKQYLVIKGTCDESKIKIG